MAKRTFAAWVEPVASVLADGRRQVVDFARSAPGTMWSRPSEAPGWTNKDMLAHLAGGNDRLLQRVLRSVTAAEPLDPSLLQLDTDAENARGVEERRNWPVDRLIADLERDGEEVQELLSQITEKDEDLRQSGFPLSLGDFLRIVERERHDLVHLEQLRAGLHGASS